MNNLLQCHSSPSLLFISPKFKLDTNEHAAHSEHNSFSNLSSLNKWYSVVYNTAAVWRHVSLSMKRLVEKAIKEI